MKAPKLFIFRKNNKRVPRFSYTTKGNSSFFCKLAECGCRKYVQGYPGNTNTQKEQNQFYRSAKETS